MTLLKVKTLLDLFPAILDLFRLQQHYTYLNSSRNDAQFSQYPLSALPYQDTNRTFQRAVLQVPASALKQILGLGSLRTEWIKIQGEKLTQNLREKPCLK